MTKSIYIILMILSCLILQTKSINCECGFEDKKSNNMALMNMHCDGQKSSGDCKCYAVLEQDFDLYAKCTISVDREGNKVRMSGWKCANGESGQDCQAMMVKKGTLTAYSKHLLMTEGFTLENVIYLSDK